jgi:DNA ligase 1
MLSGDLGVVAEAAGAGGDDALCEFRLTLFRPLQPMLAQAAETAGGAVADMGQAFVEYKLDGARIQVHRNGDDVRVYTRNLRDVTDRSPEVVAVARSLAGWAAVLDGEVIALRADGKPHPFQDTMARFGSDIGEDAPEVALVPFFFDCLHVDGRDLLDEPLSDRRAELRRVVPADYIVPSQLIDDADAADAVFSDALRAGQEGVVVKDPSAPYEAGRRGGAWRKVKPTDTLDLVILAVEWGSGRRKGWLSNLHLGARDPETGGFVMLGKTFKGMTDEMLRWQTQRLLELETHREGHVVHVRPELVVEIALDGVQTSTRYPGGVALRFARVKSYREDKNAEQADTIDRVRALRDRA